MRINYSHSPSRPPTAKRSGFLKEALEHTQEGITRSLCKNLIADVPIGDLLSGDIDSSLLGADRFPQAAMGLSGAKPL